MRLIAFGMLMLAAASATALGTVSTQATPARAAVVRALPALQRSAHVFVEARSCVSCHHNVLAIMTLHMARGRGLGVDEGVIRAIEATTFRELRDATAVDAAVQGLNISDPTLNDSYLLMAAQAAGIPRNLVTEIYARRLVGWQRGDHWETSDFRPPHASSAFTATATAVRAIRLYAPPEQAAQANAAVQRATEWLAASRPRSTEDAAFRLMGLTWAGAAVSSNEGARRDLQALQRADGGWGQLPGYPSDAYSTGEALVALHQAGIAVTERQWQKGIAFLLANQARDGTWRVRTRMLSPATVSPPYFDVSFPYRKDAFISYAATAWAVMALLSAMPEVVPPTAPRVESGAGTDPAWLRTALFGEAEDLRRLLDAGLSPRVATQGGTTVLMASATNAATVSMLLARGADAGQRAPSGVDALTVAAGYRGTAASIARLLEAGASASPPADVRLKFSPLALAAMSGDRDVVARLLSAGTMPSADALSESITFGHPEVVRVLLDAGANPRIEERSGVTLLHWAVITNRPASIPLLVAAGTAVNARDSFGFTPLMYAATIDHGHTQLVEALLAAGADRRIRNAAGRTPRQQALHYGHTSLASALR